MTRRRLDTGTLGKTQHESAPLIEGLTPRYQRIVEVLKQDIEAGKLKEGDELPSEADLRQRFSVSRHTIREALRSLREQGLVESRQGAATRIVRPEKALYTYSVSDVAELLQYATDARYAIERTSIVTADTALAARLSCLVGSKWLRVEGFRYTADDPSPLCWTEVFIQSEYSGVGVMIGRQSGTIYSLIEKMYAVRVERVDQALYTEAMPFQAIQKLGSDEQGFAIVIRRVYRLADESIPVVALNYHAPERLRLNWTLKRAAAS